MKPPADAQILVDLIRSDQMTPQQVMHLLEDRPDFAAWYRTRPELRPIRPV